MLGTRVADLAGVTIDECSAHCSDNDDCSALHYYIDGIKFQYCYMYGSDSFIYGPLNDGQPRVARWCEDLHLFWRGSVPPRTALPCG